mmetsp:Transcript_12666/g.15783  ORF Transcript_12666/g.15783 Transcript_12666/m.15783 type:complete len:97 (+) Transcript_12666:350-640(+)
MKAWAESCNVNQDDIVFLADWNGSFVKQQGLNVDLGAANLGERSKRFSMLIDNGNIVSKHVEVSPGDFEETSAEKLLAELDDSNTSNNDSDSENNN